MLSPNGKRTDDARRLVEQIAMLEAEGSRVLVVEPDSAARAAMGSFLDPSVRAAAAEAGRTQGWREAIQFKHLPGSND